MIYNVYVPKKLVLPEDFSQATWDEITAACQKNKVPESWAVGDSTNMIIWGDEEYLVDIIGKAHDDYADGSGKAPLTFMLHNCYGELWSMNSEATNAGGWESCFMRTNRLPELLEEFTAPVKEAVREVSKVTGIGDGKTTTQISTDKLFLVSAVEVYGDSRSYSTADDEGTQYDYFKSKADLTKKYGGSATRWWTRSPYTGNSASFIVVNTNSSPFVVSAEQQYGVAFAFCL